jgi:uroporphyrinogen-III synthase
MVDLERRLLPREALPLHGKRVLLTTPRNYAGLFCKPLAERGARVVLLPTIEIWPMPDYTDLDRAIREIETYDWVVFSSQNGIEACCNRLRAAGRDILNLGNVRLAAFKRDAVPAAGAGVKFDLIPPRSTLDGFIEEFTRRGITTGRALVPMPEIRGMPEPRVIPDFIEVLGGLGLEVRRVPAYQTNRVTDRVSGQPEIGMLVGGQIDVVLFTSNAEIGNLLGLLDDGREVVSRCTLACLSYAEAESAVELGLRVDVITESRSSIDLPEATASALEDYFRGK